MKKKIILLFLGVILILGIFLGINQYKKYQKKQEEIQKQEKIVAIQKELEFFHQETVLESVDDPILEIYNTLLKNSIQIEEYTSHPITLTLTDIEKKELDNVASKIEQELEQIKPLIHTYDISLETVLQGKEEYEKAVYIDTYINSPIVQKKEENIEKIKNYQATLEQMQQFISFLKNSQYSIQNEKVIYKDDSFKQTYETFSLPLNFTIEKEVDFGKAIPILMYHGVLDTPWGISSLFVRVSEFEQQMKYLKENGYTPIYLSEIRSATQYEKPIIITFDDGYLDVYTNAYPILKKYGFKANLYIITDWLGGDVYMSQQMMQALDQDLFEIGSHTLTHPALATLSKGEIERQLKDSKEKLETMLSHPITAIAYPTGSYDSRVLEIARKYYQYGLSTISDFEYAKDIHPYTLRRLKVNRGISIQTFANLIQKN